MCTRQLNESFESGSNSDQNLLFLWSRTHAARYITTAHTGCVVRWASFEYQRLLVCIICLLKWASGWGWDTGCIDVWFINGTWVENIFNPCEIFSQDVVAEQTCILCVCVCDDRDGVLLYKSGNVILGMMGITNAYLSTSNPKANLRTALMFAWNWFWKFSGEWERPQTNFLFHNVVWVKSYQNIFNYMHYLLHQVNFQKKGKLFLHCKISISPRDDQLLIPILHRFLFTENDLLIYYRLKIDLSIIDYKIE